VLERQDALLQEAEQKRQVLEARIAEARIAEAEQAVPVAVRDATTGPSALLV
jgi:hypothetical protein